MARVPVIWEEIVNGYDRALQMVFQCSFIWGCGWFRLFGIGLAWVDSDRYGELLARRYVGKHGWKDRRQLKIGSWRFALTTRRNP